MTVFSGLAVPGERGLLIFFHAKALVMVARQIEHSNRIVLLSRLFCPFKGIFSILFHALSALIQRAERTLRRCTAVLRESQPLTGCFGKIACLICVQSLLERLFNALLIFLIRFHCLLLQTVPPSKYAVCRYLILSHRTSKVYEKNGRNSMAQPYLDKNVKCV